MNLFMFGDYTLNSGAKSRWKLECDALIVEDIKALAEMIRQMVGGFSSVEGVPTGGLRLAAELRRFAGFSGPHLIVDDVLTTGGSMERTKDQHLATHGGNVIGAVVFARGQCPHWIKAVFQMSEVFWLKPKHR